MENLAVVTNMSSFAVVNGVAADGGWHTTTSADMNFALTENLLLPNIAAGG
jgi:hypothetical protein